MPTATPPSSQPSSASSRGLRTLRHDDRVAIYESLLESSSNGRLPRGAFVQHAQTHQCHWKTISRVWTRAQESLRRGSLTADVASKIREIKMAVQGVDMYARQTLRALWAHSGIPKTTLVQHMRDEKNLRARASYVRPHLTDANAVTRMKHAMSFLQPTSSGNQVFADMNSYIHVDEKWFFLTKVKRKFYAYSDEVVPASRVKSKRFITKVMFLAAVARPRYDFQKKSMFDGKIGIWPFVVQLPAQRNSKNRVKGTMLTVPQSVTSDVYRAMILDNVVPAIKEKMPRNGQGGTIYMQQDNASPHNGVTSKMLLERGVQGIVTINQPPPE
ncbi:hypothetical protein H257_07943 [Aphanomyces astaci]|uniref:DUF7769 domain-containing protein n=1 Tax=Aphanomyces astaci TaxID=112090 RepID=W4GHD6_APHAT|nr:hypothetical protein H257_07943 [Aphanomyces astaci]ETV78383.1 hypothetical protein H257_07943 [Aphanomyces astaci]|eukprot:XP_009831964.1 hypothetical protein H257_07943 [Aphanomyces astaci]